MYTMERTFFFLSAQKSIRSYIKCDGYVRNYISYDSVVYRHKMSDVDKILQKS